MESERLRARAAALAGDPGLLTSHKDPLQFAQHALQVVRAVPPERRAAFVLELGKLIAAAPLYNVAGMCAWAYAVLTAAPEEWTRAAVLACETCPKSEE